MARALAVCSEPGCPNLTDAGMCDTHRQERWRETNAARPSPYSLGYNARWARWSRRYLAAHPLCATCGHPAQHAHHIDGKGPAGPNGHDPANLKPLCRPCHSRVTATQHGLGHTPQGRYPQTGRAHNAWGGGCEKK